MDRPPHTPPPSAMDGFRRLERTRSQPTEPQPRARRRRISARLTGALRMAGFVTVVALVVGTSVSLALTDPQEAAQTKVREEAPAPVVHTVERTETVAEPAATPRAAEPEPVRAAPAPEPTAVPAEPAPAASVSAHRALPMTGPSVLQYALLGGAGLVLLGMLVQIAGQPLPASSCTRRASRLT